MRLHPSRSACAVKNAETGLFLGFILLGLWMGRGFSSTAEIVWARDGWVLTGSVGVLSLAALQTLTLLVGARPALKFMAWTVVLTWLAEVVGLRYGWPFGAIYQYHADVHPLLPGGVPLFIPLAWFMLACFPVMLLRSLSTAGRAGACSVRRVAFKSVLGACCMVACDLALDPFATCFGLWMWERPGAYYGIPWTNFAGWWVVSFAVFLVGYGGLGLKRSEKCPIPLRYDLVWGLAHSATFIMLGFGLFHRMGSLGPLWLSLLGIGPISLGWTISVYWKIRSHWPIRSRHGES